MVADRNINYYNNTNMLSYVRRTAAPSHMTHDHTVTQADTSVVGGAAAPGLNR